MSAVLRCLAALTFLLTAATAQAGTWTRLQPADMGDCAVLFEGPIGPGDLTQAIGTGLLDGFNTRICLNSPGGSLGEVLAFLQASERGDTAFFFGTRVRSGDECLSSCAILFMFGQSFGANSPYPSRQLEPGARLGFHSPFIRDGAATAASDAEVFKVALQVAKLLADRSYKAVTADGAALPQELLALVLGTPSAEMRYVETLGEAKVMNIELTRNIETEVILQDRREVLEPLIKQICIASHTLTFRQHMVDEGYDFADLVERATDPATTGPDYEITAYVRNRGDGNSGNNDLLAVVTGPGYFQPGWFSAGSMMYCRVAMSFEPAPGGVKVQWYYADFDFISDTDLTRVPDETYRFEVMTGGLLPLDTRF
ncbi:hypothetical protein [Maliponia aquimaris]|uniref:Uncharacterized protein n=1 Tax=Maliponia aquimaris TaxID=1673631 RepID=A0A238K7V4_9RHOB|nr:hypothetical protein [Maliponia aquimaris]SMX38036.1 hypothetical protein MAA8898_01346 [Maliponia aquimaris]